jgi:type IV pilus assembly protein PilP
MMFRRMTVLLALLFLAGAVVPGQVRAQEAAPAPAPEKAAEPAENEEKKRSVAEALEDENFRYNAAGRRDPFKSLLVLQEKKKDISLLPPIQQLDLKEIRITGIVMDEREGPRAMIKAKGRTFIVKKGTIIGKNEGEVIEVTLLGFRVVEKYVDFMGRETLKEVFIKARPDKKE